MKKTITVTMFRTFTMECDGMTIHNDNIKSEKLIKLLTYLLYYYNRSISSSELIDYIWCYDEIGNPIGALKNLIYRLRIILKKVMKIDDLIITGKSCYYINENYIFSIDAHLFEQYNKELLNKTCHKDLYKQLIDLYKGSFLTEVQEDHRALSRSAYFHSLYISRVIEYANLLECQEKYQAMESVARKAIAIDNLEEGLYIILIKALYYQGLYQQASNTYIDSTNLLYRSLGTHPSQDMNAVYKLIKKEKYTKNINIREIHKGLTNKQKNGAYLCEYGTFKDLYNLQARLMDRLEISTHLCFVSINDSSCYQINQEKNTLYVEEIMQMIQAAFVSGLRIGDVVSRFSINQFVVMLPVCNYENALLVLERVLKDIKQLLSHGLTIDISVKAVEVAQASIIGCF